MHLFCGICSNHLFPLPPKVLKMALEKVARTESIEGVAPLRGSIASPFLMRLPMHVLALSNTLKFSSTKALRFARKIQGRPMCHQNIDFGLGRKTVAGWRETGRFDLAISRFSQNRCALIGFSFQNKDNGFLFQLLFVIHVSWMGFLSMGFMLI